MFTVALEQFMRVASWSRPAAAARTASCRWPPMPGCSGLQHCVGQSGEMAVQLPRNQVVVSPLSTPGLAGSPVIMEPFL